MARGGKSSSPFPTKLHELLDDARSENHEHVISWCRDGKSFRIHRSDLMVGVLKSYFRQTKYKSLLRQLQGYDFKRITSGKEKGNVSHPLFVRGMRSLCKDMKRKQARQPYSVIANESLKKEQEKGKDKRPSRPDKVSSMKNSLPSKTDMLASQQLESTFQSSMKNAILQAQNHQYQHRRSHQATGLDALRVEIGCTFSSPKPKTTMRMSSSTSSLKRPDSQLLVQTSESAPEFGSDRISKRPRRDGIFHKNASFSFPGETIHKEENMRLQKETQRHKDFEQLEKLCFSNVPQGTGLQKFQHTHHSNSSHGTLDLDISLTTTTTTAQKDGSGSQEVTNGTICNKFILPSVFEPTPIQSSRKDPAKAKACTINDGFTLICDISFPSNFDINKDEQLKRPEPEDEPLPLRSIEDSSASDEIDEGIAEAFTDKGDGNNGWDSMHFDANKEEAHASSKTESEDRDDWTKGIFFEGETDCDLEPEKFQVECQSMIRIQPNPTQSLPVQYGSMTPPQRVAQHQQILKQQQALLQQQQITPQLAQHKLRLLQIQHQQQRLLQQQQLISLPMQQMMMSANIQPRQHLPHSPYAGFSKPVPFIKPNFQNQIQIQQLKR